MVQITNASEYALHCLLWLNPPSEAAPSARDLAELQGVPTAYLSKIMPKLEKAGIVRASGGIKGGYQLARSAEDISVLDVVDAVEGEKPLFACQEIRARCALFGGVAPGWATSGTCGIHAVMLRAERAMRTELARTSLSDLSRGLNRKMPPSFAGKALDWIWARKASRTENQIASLKRRSRPR